MRALHISPFTSATPSLHGPTSGVSADIGMAISCCWGLRHGAPASTGLTHLNPAWSLLHFQLGPPHSFITDTDVQCVQVFHNDSILCPLLQCHYSLEISGAEELQHVVRLQLEPLTGSAYLSDLLVCSTVSLPRL